jgi:hypothetical protein
MGCMLIGCIKRLIIAKVGQYSPLSKKLADAIRLGLRN